jgi:type 1 glutamine amidotransferase
LERFPRRLEAPRGGEVSPSASDDPIFEEFTMRSLIAAGLALGMSLGASTLADEPTKPIRVLLTIGGHDFQEAEFFAMWDRMPGVVYKKVMLPEAGGLLKPGLEKDYDVVVLYDMFTGFTPEQKANFAALMKDSGIGLLALHHSLNSHRDWPEYHAMIGGKWIDKPETIAGKPYAASTYSHDEEVPVTVADPSHPITKGLAPFTIHDETYGGVYVAPDVHVLLKTDHPKNVPAVAWTKPYGKSRVVYLMSGHDAKAWANPAFRELIARGLRWVAKREASR